VPQHRDEARLVLEVGDPLQVGHVVAEQGLEADALHHAGGDGALADEGLTHAALGDAREETERPELREHSEGIVSDRA
jgi:hypothetical protein